jgi:predicted phosphodiesterase
MKIKVVSDLHLEFSDIDIKNDEGCDVLILSGDIMVAEDLYRHAAADFNPYSSGAFADLSRRMVTAQRFRDFLKRVSDTFPHVVYVAGNHEFYHFRWFQTLDVLREECATFDNVYFLEQDVKKIDDVTFIGGTLWTDMNKNDPLTMHAVRDMMNDYRVIKNDKAGFTSLKPADTVVRFTRMVKYIQSVIEGKFDEKFVVCGHHSPSKQSTHPRYASDFLMNGAYSSDLSDFIIDHPQIKLWTHGHTHHPFDYLVGTTRIVCNPRGYEGYEDDSGWNPNIVLEI